MNTESNARAGVLVQTIEERLEVELQEFDKIGAAEDWLQAMRDTAEGLRIEDPNDMEGIEAAKRLKKELQEKRLEVEKTRQRLKKPALDYGRRVDEVGKGLIQRIEEVEAIPAAALKWVEEQRKAEQNRLLEQERQRIEGRQAQLFSMGFAWNGQSYTAPWGTAIAKDTLNDARETEWVGLMKAQDTQAAAWKEEQDAKARAAQAAEELARQNEARAAELAAQEARLKAQAEQQEAERIRLEQAKAEEQRRALLAVGMERGEEAASVSRRHDQVERNDEGFLLLSPDAAPAAYTPEELADLEPQAWANLLAAHTLRCEHLSKETAEAMERSRIYSERKAALLLLRDAHERAEDLVLIDPDGRACESIDLGELAQMHNTEFERLAAHWQVVAAANLRTAERRAEEQRKAEEERIRAEEVERLAREETARKEQEEARLAAASDRERFAAWAEKVRATAPKGGLAISPAMKWAVKHVLDAMAEGESHIAEAAGQ